MKALKLNNDAYEILLIALKDNPNFNFISQKIHARPDKRYIDIPLTEHQLETLGEGLVEVIRTRGTTDGRVNNYGLKLDSIVQEIISQFWG
ncbi:hypothetical protein ACS5NO_20600 [Larkinella sp. GY13]|uniref:hypothetical protein n=1 Tax=Larkinella sp. GY13 TaxID=3453720 RepID=UPI003EEA775F